MWNWLKKICELKGKIYKFLLTLDFKPITSDFWFIIRSKDLMTVINWNIDQSQFWQFPRFLGSAPLAHTAAKLCSTCHSTSQVAILCSNTEKSDLWRAKNGLNLKQKLDYWFYKLLSEGWSLQTLLVI